MNSLKDRLGKDQYEKLARLGNEKLFEFVGKYVELCNPARIFVATDDPADRERIRNEAIEAGEETPLSTPGHTIHFENYLDQGRDKEHTGILVPKGTELEPMIETRDREAAYKEIHEILKNIMQGGKLYVLFFCLGPANSEFSIPCVQITDSPYVAHSEFLLYRPGYEEFKRQGKNARFFRFVHSQGAVTETKVSKNLDQRRIYIDIEDNTVYSTNTQYGGNTIGLKKLAMRLAIRRGEKEGWLTEHMLVMGIHGPKGRVTYFTGAYPSMCGKTSTAMLDGETIVGDDIAYLRTKDGKVRAVNVEKGMFGIIQGVNSKDDPMQWKALHLPNEIIFSNILVVQTPDGKKGVHWIGKDGAVPPKGYNHSGDWEVGKKDAKGKEITCSHPNARFTISLSSFDNLDKTLDDPNGVEVGAMVYGGRDSDTCVPVEEAFDWQHGIALKGAALESETTAATLGKEGVREFNPMSNLDFLSIPIGRYVGANFDFGKKLTRAPKIFSVNYFLKHEGKFLNEKTDKKVWFKWMELRVHGDAGAIETPTGRIPKYEDLKRLFKDVLAREYRKEDYVKQFTLRIPENLAKLDRVKTIYETKVKSTPKDMLRLLQEQKDRLLKAKEKYGDYVSPDVLAGVAASLP
ncbi:MAG: phosphoenolpyruvate carboxykinase (GTP) [Planctomycetota bacterium]|nr:phosphoenolpyruvate carboxykinase (GTP) [Planctomycetota bacterium]